MVANKKIKCEKCGRIRRSRYITHFKGKLLCSDCKPKMQLGKRISLELALNKTYLIKEYIDKKGSIHAQISIPSVLAGKKVKLVVIGK